jgi:hypothetical protein
MLHGMMQVSLLTARSPDTLEICIETSLRLLALAAMLPWRWLCRLR